MQLSKAQLQKLVKGKPVQLKHDALSGGAIKLVLHPAQQKKVDKAKRLLKGIRIQLSPEEVEASGLKEVLERGFKEAVKLGKAYVKKQGGTRKLLTKGLEKALPLLASTVNPLLSAPVSKLTKAYADDIVGFVGDKTGAFGVCEATRGGKAILSSDYSNFLAPVHPASRPKRSKLPAIGEYVLYVNHDGSIRSSGGSFKVSGGSFLAN